MATLSGGATSACSFATNGTFVVTGSDDGLVKIFNAETGAEVRSMYGAHRQERNGIVLRRESHGKR